MVDKTNKTSAAETVSKTAPNGTQTQSNWNGRFSITITLVTAIGLLILISVGGVLGVGVWLAQKNTFALLSSNAHQTVSAEADRIKQHLAPAEHQAKFIAERIASGEIDPNDRDRFGLLLTGALAAAPQIDRIIFVNNNLMSFFASYDRQHGQITLEHHSYAGDPIIEKRMSEVVSSANWGTAVWRADTDKTYLNVAFPVSVKGKSIGVVVAVVTVENLSNFVDEALGETSGRRFILAGQNRVLAHWLMANGYPGRSNQNPLPSLAGFADPVLSAIWRKEGREDLVIKLPEGTKGHVIELASQYYIFFYREILGFGPEPLIAGIYFHRADVGK